MRVVTRSFVEKMLFLVLVARSSSAELNGYVVEEAKHSSYGLCDCLCQSLTMLRRHIMQALLHVKNEWLGRYMYLLLD